MNERQIIEALAEIDGGDWLYNPLAENPHRFWAYSDAYISHRENFEICEDKSLPVAEYATHFKDYLNSYDAILPLVHKQTDAIKELIIDNMFKYIEDLSYVSIMGLLDLTPKDISILLLKSHGKYTD